MKSLKPYANCSKTFFLAAGNAKTDASLLSRLGLIEDEVGNSYDVYDGCFDDNTLTILTPNNILSKSKDDLQSLYSYRSKTIRKLREEVAALQPQAIRYICQYCTLVPVQSMDHYLPKEEFPEFSVHTLNLVPCCRACNGYKSYIWRNGTERLFINYYLDKLPEEQYLFVNISKDFNGEIDFQFILDNPSGISKVEFDLLSSHFTRLKLFKRMKRAAVGVISELKNSMLAGMEKSTMASVIDVVKSTAYRNKLSYGNNHWKVVLELALVESNIFLTHLSE